MKVCKSCRASGVTAKTIEKAKKVAETAVRLTDRECDRCGNRFIPLCWTQRYCSRRCGNKAGRIRRRTREAGTYGEWRWSDFMRIAHKFDYCCAYCDTKLEEIIPEHVIPLSRGGTNTLSNLLPSCRKCNSHKRDLLLEEWAEDQVLRGSEPVCTTWAVDDKRFTHLAMTSPGVPISRRVA